MDEQYSIIWTLKHILNYFLLLFPIICFCCYNTWDNVFLMSPVTLHLQSFPVTSFWKLTFSCVSEWNWPREEHMHYPLQRVLYWAPGCVSLTVHANALISLSLHCGGIGRLQGLLQWKKGVHIESEEWLWPGSFVFFSCGCQEISNNCFMNKNRPFCHAHDGPAPFGHTSISVNPPVTQK